MDEQGRAVSVQDIVEERRWRKWVDDTLVHTLSPNVYRSPGEVTVILLVNLTLMDASPILRFLNNLTLTIVVVYRLKLDGIARW